METGPRIQFRVRINVGDIISDGDASAFLLSGLHLSLRRHRRLRLHVVRVLHAWRPSAEAILDFLGPRRLNPALGFRQHRLGLQIAVRLDLARRVTVTGSMDALRELDNGGIDIVVADVGLQPNEPHGISLGRMILTKAPTIAVLFITGRRELTEKDFPGDVLFKPIDLEELARKIGELLAKQGPAS